MAKRLRVLLIEDNEDDAALILRELRRGGYQPEALRVENLDALRRALDQDWHLVLSDYHLPSLTGMDALRIAQQDGRDIPFILVSGIMGEEAAVEAMRAGVHDYILKDNLPRLVPAVNRELREALERRARRAAEEALRESEEQYRILVESSPYSIHQINQEGCFVSMNASGLRMMGVSSEHEIVGRPFLESVSGQDRKRVVSRLSQAYRGESVEFEYRTADGRILHSFLVPIFVSESGVRLMGLSRDITERKRIEDDLRESEERYRELFQNANDIIYAHDLDGNFTSVNRAGRRVFGYSDSEVPRLNVAEVLAPDYLKRIQGLVDRHTGPESKSTYEMEVQTKSGERVPIEVGTRLLTENGVPVGVQGIARDLTERKRSETERARLEAQLRHAQKLETVGTLAGGIAHDFNNVLQAILGYTHMAAEDVEPGSRTRDNLDHVTKAADRARDLVRQILTFSRQVEMERRPIQIQPIVKEALKLLRNSLPATIEIRQHIGADCPAVLADATQIHQILMNLGTNAAHAMRGRAGVLEMTLDWVELDADFVRHRPNVKSGQHVRLRVSDTGHGMDQPTCDRVFEPFFTTKTGEGTGLGLSVVHGIVVSHGGEISVSSEVDRGTTFCLYFPRADSQIEIAVPREETVSPGQENILFVDDEEDLVLLGRRMLQRLGYTVSVETDSLQALERFRAQPHDFDLVITDHTMPQMTGIKLAGELLGIRPDLPIILTTGFSETVASEAGTIVGIRKTLMKPVGFSELGKTVRLVLDG